MLGLTCADGSCDTARPDDAPAQYNVTQVSYIITLFSVWALIQPRRLTQPTEGGLDSLDEWKRHVIDADRRALRRTSHAERVAIVVAGPGVGRLLEFYVDRLDVCEPTEVRTFVVSNAPK